MQDFLISVGNVHAIRQKLQLILAAAEGVNCSATLIQNVMAINRLLPPIPEFQVSA